MCRCRNPGGCACCGPQRAAARRRPADLTPQDLARIWDAEHVSPPLPPLLDHAEVVAPARRGRRSGTRTCSRSRRSASRSRAARSTTSRVGTGPIRVLLWSQMHGDEPTATSALFDLFEYLRRHRDEPVRPANPARQLTLHVVPMLNPDGAERFQRRNAQGIDINRDALRLQTPEGRVLKALRDRLNPRVGFNLHNQSWRTSVGDPPKPASISLLSVAYDEARTENAGPQADQEALRRHPRRARAVRVRPDRPLRRRVRGARVRRQHHAVGHAGRADRDRPVAVGTSPIRRWSGSTSSRSSSALDALATGSVEKADPKRYEELPINESRRSTCSSERHGHQRNGHPARSRRTSAIVANRRVQVVDGRREIQTSLAHRRHGRSADAGRAPHDRRDGQ